MELGSAIKSVWALRTGKILALVLVTMAAMGMFFVTFFVKGMRDAYVGREAYEAKLAAPKAMNTSASELHSDSVKSPAEVIRKVDQLMDSMGLGGDVRGYLIVCDLRPWDFLIKANENAAATEVFLSCGCSQRGLYDVMTIDVDPISLNATVRRIERHVSREMYAKTH